MVLGARVATPPSLFCTQSSLASWLLQWMSEASDDDKAAMIQGLYALWLARNDTRDGKRIEEAVSMARRVATLMDEWNKVHARQETPQRTTQHAIWEPPATGWLKANVDGATSRWGQDGGAAIVFRDELGAFRGVTSIFLPRIS